MRVLLLNQFFHPDLAATSQLASDLAVDLARRGASVTAVAGQASYVGSGRYPRRESWQGIEILRVPMTRFGRGSIAGRMSDYLSFLASCAAQLAALEAPDVLITLSTPPLLSLLGSLRKLASGRRTRLVYWVQDLYPEVAIQFGVLRENGLPARALSQMARASLESADAVVALGETMAERLEQKGASRERLHVIHNWSDGESLGQVPPEENWFLDQHGLRGKFVVLYSGNMGRGHDFETLLAAAEKLAGSKEIVFLFIGEGARRGEVEAAASRLPNVRLLPYQPRENLPYSLGAASLSAITMTDGLAGLIVPSKLYGALASRTPVLFIGPEQSETARVIAQSGCGMVFARGDVAGVSAFIEQLAHRRELGVTMGQRGREAFERRFDRTIATGRFAELLGSLCGAAGGVSRAQEVSA